MSYVTENNETYRNMQEQVLKNAEDIAVMKQGPFISYSVNTVLDLVPLTTEANYGKYILVGTTAPKHLYVITHRANEGLLADDLGEYPAKGQTGETGATGATGPQGTRGPALWQVGSTLPSPASPYIENDLILLSAGECKGQIYKLNNGMWMPITSIRGPEGPVGPSAGIVANPTVPEGETPQSLNFLKIDGIYYSTSHLTTAMIVFLTACASNMEWSEDGSVTFGHDVTADGNVVAHNDVEVGRKLYVDDVTKIQDPNGVPLVRDYENFEIGLKPGASGVTLNSILKNDCIWDKASGWIHIEFLCNISTTSSQPWNYIWRIDNVEVAEKIYDRFVGVPNNSFNIDNLIGAFNTDAGSFGVENQRTTMDYQRANCQNIAINETIPANVTGWVLIRGSFYVGL